MQIFIPYFQVLIVTLFNLSDKTVVVHCHLNGNGKRFTLSTQVLGPIQPILHGVPRL